MKVQSIAECLEHSAILSIIGTDKPIIGLLFEWPLKTGFTISSCWLCRALAQVITEVLKTISEHYKVASRVPTRMWLEHLSIVDVC